MVYRNVSDIALKLLKAMDEHQAKGSEEELVDPYEAARHVEELEPGSPFYDLVVRHLLRNDAIVEDEWMAQQQVVGTTIYTISAHGFQIIRGEERLH